MALSMRGPAPQLVRPALGNAAEFMADAWQRTAADSIDVRAFSVIN